MRRRLPIVVRLVVVLGVLLVGCGGGEAKDPGSGGEAKDPGSAADGPSLSDFVPVFVDFTGASAEQEYLRQEREAQDAIAACMAAQGFEYIPYVPSQDESGFSMPSNEEEWVEEYGFAIATLMLQEALMLQDMDEETMAAEMARDPNNAIVDAMSDSERDAYYVALYGEPDPGQYAELGDDYGRYEETMDDFVTATIGVPVVSGCRSQAYEAAYGLGTMDEFYDQFGPMMMDMYAGFESDPRIVALDAEWSSCMAKQGYEFATEFDARVHVMRRLEEVGAIADLDISDGGWSYSGERFEPGSATEAAVKEIAAEEVVIAKASLECSANREKVYQEVMRDAEQRFIEENLAELEQFKREHS